MSFNPDRRKNPLLLGVDWNDSRRNFLEIQKIAAPKKSSTFAVGFSISLLKTRNF